MYKLSLQANIPNRYITFYDNNIRKLKNLTVRFRNAYGEYGSVIAADACNRNEKKYDRFRPWRIVGKNVFRTTISVRRTFRQKNRNARTAVRIKMASACVCVWGRVRNT